jgi:hypothetical protein
MRLAVTNIWDNHDIIDSSFENVQYPPENTQNPHTTTQWISDDCNDEYITIASSSESINTVIISGHNLSNAAVITLLADDTPDWGAPAVSEVVTWREDHCIKFFTATAKAYYRITIDDPANVDGVIKIGRIFLGTYTQITPSSYASFNITNSRNDVVQKTETGNVYGSIGSSFRVFKYSFPKISMTMLTTLRTIFSTVGTVKPIYLFNFDTYWTYINPAYVRIVDNLDEEWTGNNKVRYSLTFEEVV